jgi:hypothetical protein
LCIYPTISWSIHHFRAPGLLPKLDCCEQCCNGHRCTGVQDSLLCSDLHSFGEGEWRRLRWGCVVDGLYIPIWNRAKKPLAIPLSEVGRSRRASGRSGARAQQPGVGKLVRGWKTHFPREL